MKPKKDEHKDETKHKIIRHEVFKGMKSMAKWVPVTNRPIKTFFKVIRTSSKNIAGVK